MKLTPPLSITIALLGAIAACALPGCGTTIPKDALVLKEPPTEIRSRQSRSFATTDEKAVLLASSQLLQDLGFTLEESSKEVGLLVGSKDRTAVDGGQVVGQIAAAVFLGVRVAIDKDQKIRASVVTAPSARQDRMVVRVTFQRLVWNDRGVLAKVERLDAPELYTEFFEKLSKSLFLEAQEIG